MDWEYHCPPNQLNHRLIRSSLLFFLEGGQVFSFLKEIYFLGVRSDFYILDHKPQLGYNLDYEDGQATGGAPDLMIAKI